MTLDDNEKIFLIPIGKKYVQFRFKPYTMMETFLDDYNIKYQESTECFSGVSLVTSGQQPLTYYRIKCNNIHNRKYHQFAFTSNIIDKVLNYYKVDYERRRRLWKK